MATNEITLTEQTGQFLYCRRYNGATYDNYDTEALTRVGTQQDMMADTSDFMYWGAAAAFQKIGFRMHTAGDYGALTWEYWSGAGWSTFTPILDDTNGFENHGYVAWGTLANWAANTEDGQSAFWIRISAASVSTTAKFYSFLLNVTLHPPLGLPVPANPDLFHRDINGTLYASDVTYTGPYTISVECTFKALNTDSSGSELETLNLLAWLIRNKVKLDIIDEAQTATPDPQLDSFYKSYAGYLTGMTPTAWPAYGKMRPGEFTLEFQIDTATAMM